MNKQIVICRNPVRVELAYFYYLHRCVLCSLLNIR